MKPLTVPTIAILLLMIAAIGCSPKPGIAVSEQEPLVVFLVRHAEKVDASDDPELSPGGRDRAATLARTLRDAEIGYVHSSDYIRTRDTAAPVAAEHGLEAELYDARDLPALAEKLRRTGGRHLVVGHSNTTLQMVELLGGEPGTAIDDKSEFDRLYVVTVGRDGMGASAILRYGE